ncbi:MAG: hypothetical protein AAB267_01260, partial [Candidatus Desantisbacteria bacterium]
NYRDRGDRDWWKESAKDAFTGSQRTSVRWENFIEALKQEFNYYNTNAANSAANRRFIDALINLQAEDELGDPTDPAYGVSPRDAERFKKLIEEFVNAKESCVWRNLRDIQNVREAMREYIKDIYDQEEGETDLGYQWRIQKLVKNKVQLVLGKSSYCYDSRGPAIQEVIAYCKAHDIEYAYRESSVGNWPAITKYGAFSDVLFYLTKDITQMLDNDCEIRMDQARNILYVLPEFKENTRLGVLLTNMYLYTEHTHRIPELTALAEEAWTGPVQRCAKTTGKVLFCGKGYQRTEFMLRYENLQDDDVMEDLMSSIRARTFGIDTDHTDLVKIGAGFVTTVRQALSVFGKYASDSFELILSKNGRRYLYSLDIPFNEKLVSCFLLYFYWKKILIYMANMGFMTAYWTRGLDPYIVAEQFGTNIRIGLGALGYIWAEMVNVLGYRAKQERYGAVKALEWMATRFPFSFLFYTMLLSVPYAVKVNSGSKGRSNFDITGQDDRLLRMRFKDIWSRQKFAFQTAGVYLALFVSRPYHKYRYLTAGLILCLIFSTLFGPFFFNARWRFDWNFKRDGNWRASGNRVFAVI